MQRVYLSFTSTSWLEVLQLQDGMKIYNNFTLDIFFFLESLLILIYAPRWKQAQ